MKRKFSQLPNNETLTNNTIFPIVNENVTKKQNIGGLIEYIKDNVNLSVNTFSLNNFILTNEDIGKFVVSYTDEVELNNHLKNGGDFSTFSGVLNEARLPELETYNGNNGVFEFQINYDFLNMYNENDQICFVSVSKEGDDGFYDSFELRLSNFKFNILDDFYSEMLNHEEFSYELFSNEKEINLYYPNNSKSYLIMLNYFFEKGFPRNYDEYYQIHETHSLEFMNFINKEILVDKIILEVDKSLNEFYFSGNDRFLEEMETYVKFIDNRTIQKLIPILPEMLRRKIVGELVGINGDKAIIKPINDYHESFVFNHLKDDNGVIINGVSIDDYDEYDDDYDVYNDIYIPYVNGIMYNYKYVLKTFNYKNNFKNIFNNVTPYFTPVVTDKITNKIKFIKTNITFT